MKSGTLVLGVVSLLVVGGCSSGSDTQDSSGLRVVADKKPEGSVEMDKDEMAKKGGIPIYPGSDVPQGGSTVTAGVTESSFKMTMVTSDPLKKVLSYYKTKLPTLNGGMNNGTADMLGTTSTKAPIHVTISSKDGKTTVVATAIVENSAK